MGRRFGRSSSAEGGFDSFNCGVDADSNGGSAVPPGSIADSRISRLKIKCFAGLMKFFPMCTPRLMIFEEDVKLMGDIGLEGYRFSISWSRVIPNGRGAVNPKGIEYYNNLINELVKKGIEIHVSLYQLDHPQILEDEYGGWRSPRIVEDFTTFADVCFWEFGDRVAHWTTLVQPNVMTIGGYDQGFLAPGRCSYPFGFYCPAGNSSVEPYIVVHNGLLAHASVVQLYRRKYQVQQKGVIGISVYTFWPYPFTNTTADIEATQRVRDHMIGWIFHPVVFGDYPEVMKKNAGSRIPAFTRHQSKLLQGSFDFIGINHYTSFYVSDKSNSPVAGLRDYNGDMLATLLMSANDTSGGQFDPSRVVIDPSGLQRILEYLKETYRNPPIYVQENGKSDCPRSI